MKFCKAYKITLISLLAGANAALELVLGNYLHLIKFPFTGMIMVGINLVCYVVGYSKFPKRGTVLTIGFLTAFLNLALGGTFKLWAIVAILIEAAIIEAIFMVMGFSFLSTVVSSWAVSIFTLLYAPLRYVLFFGKNTQEVVLQMVSNVVKRIDCVDVSIIVIIFFIVVAHLLSGFLFGWLSWRIKDFLPKNCNGWN